MNWGKYKRISRVPTIRDGVPISVDQIHSSKQMILNIFLWEMSMCNRKNKTVLLHIIR